MNVERFVRRTVKFLVGEVLGLKETLFSCADDDRNNKVNVGVCP